MTPRPHEEIEALRYPRRTVTGMARTTAYKKLDAALAASVGEGEKGG